MGRAAARVASCTDRYSSQIKSNYFAELCSGSEAGSYSRLIAFVYYSTLGLRVIKKKKDLLHLVGRAAARAAQGVRDLFFFITLKHRVE